MEGLDATTRERLDRFADEFDGVSGPMFAAFTGPEDPDERTQAAMDVAVAELRSPSRHRATKDAVDRFVHAAEVRYAEGFNVAHLIGMNAIARQSPDDRVRVLKALERAVVAIILWDRLRDDERAALAGPWGELVERAVGEAA